jgi:hypothetical protein
MRVLSLIFGLFLCLVSANAEVSKKQARKAIATAAGFDLPSSSVRVDRIVSSTNGSAEVSTQLELVFRLARDKNGQWRIQELRTGEARWDDIKNLVEAFQIQSQPEKCDPEKNQYGRYTVEADLSVKRARCLVADLFAVDLPSDAARIKEISMLGLGTQPSAVAVTLIQANFRLANASGNWRAVGVHTGNREWVALDTVVPTVDSKKRSRTADELNVIAAALDAFKKDRGSFVVSDRHSVLIDNLTPHYLTRVMRLDAWHHPFQYQGDHEHFTLRSLGPDGKENTADDIVVSR